MDKEYYIGLDMGTNSVGWAVTDTNYNILRAKGKDLFGIREFDAAQGAASRRVSRTSRRAKQREQERRNFLRALFAKEINKVDGAFFLRLDESKYHPEDKTTGTKYGLFDDEDYTDIQHFHGFPSTAHLRKELIENPEWHDIRLIFLAVNNIFKHRGHFLNAGLKAEAALESVEELFLQLMEKAKEIEESFDGACILSGDTSKLEDILTNKKLTRKEKLEELTLLFGINKSKEKVKNEILKALIGNKIKPAILFGKDLFDEDSAKMSFSFKEDVDEKMNELEGIIDDDCIEFLEMLKAVHDAGVLAGIMRGHTYLSMARVASYEKHKEDLKILKKVIRKYCKDDYDGMFRDLEAGNYSAYVGKSFTNGVHYRRNVKGRKQKDFYDTVLAIMDKIPDCPEKEYILQEIECENFMPKQMTSDNGVIPMQLHLAELEAILANAEAHYPFLLETNEYGLTVSEQIIELFKHQIPFYVGPLKNTAENNAWVKRSEEKIFPWNFDEVVDMKATRLAFIENLIGTCTYLREEQILPKNSMLYQAFQLLNEMNALRLYGKRLTVEQKQKMFKELFLSGKKVTKKGLKKYLVKQGWLKAEDEAEISGIDKEFKSTMSSYGKFYKLFGKDLLEPQVWAMVEDIIFLGTAYGKDKAMYFKVISEKYGEELTEEQIGKICNFRFKEWGNLSKEFLEMHGVSNETGESIPLINRMWNENEILMELMSSRYTYAQEVQQRTIESTKMLRTLEYEDLDGMYLSAPVKRMVWQTILVLKEIIEVMGCEPKRIFLEMAREHGEKKPTKSRKSQLKEGLKKQKGPETAELLTLLNQYEEEDLRGKKLYLYFTQRGRCMYTGNRISIEDLFDDNLYDTDHIYARHFKKDNSQHDNLVLVTKQLNARKGDSYPIPDSIFNSQNAMWLSLKQDKLITEEKYNRLASRTPLTDEQLAGFVAGQLVETRQGTKALANIIKSVLPNTEIVYVKAKLISDFRTDFDMLKTRSVNDLHHAQDAYLSIVVGNAYNTKFTKNPMNFIKGYRNEPQNYRYHMDRVFDFDIVRAGETAWIAGGPNATIHTVRKVMQKTSPLITRMSYEAHGSFYNATIYGKDKAKDGSYLPLKTTDARLCDMSKYGGYTSITSTYFFLVEHEIRGNKVRTIEFVPLILKDKIKNRQDLENYCVNQLNLVNPRICVERIKVQSLIRINGYNVYLSGRTENRYTLRNAISLYLSQDWMNYVKKIENAPLEGKVNRKITAEKNLELFDILNQKLTQTIFANRPNPIGTKLSDNRDRFEALNLNKQCKVLREILKLTTCGVTKADLSDIGLKANVGIMSIGKNITDYDEFTLIHQSPTGLYESRVDLLTV